MADNIKADICIIGAGSGGLSVAAGASQLGASVVLIEKDKMGGEFLNYGCVPSKAMLAAGHAAEGVRQAGRFGARAAEPNVDSAGVYGHIDAVIAAIEPNDSVERFEGMGVKVIKGEARFTGPAEVSVGETMISARRFVIATGSGAFLPPIPGLKDVDFFTNETIFSATTLPAHLIIVGGGPIGIELAQAHRHLGCRVTVLEMFTVMPKDDPELVDVVRRQLEADGVTIIEHANIKGIEKTKNGIDVKWTTGDGGGPDEILSGSHILVAAGRRPTVHGLGLDEAGIRYSDMGIGVDARLRTSNKKIFAIGDVAGGLQFTHVAGYHAGVVIKNALFRWPAKVDTGSVPWVTFTAPELAQVGLTEAQAKDAHGDIRVLRWPYHENDRAQAEKETEGMIKAVVTAKGKILGCGIAGAHAGELIQTWVLAKSKNLKIGDMAQMITPYPTFGEVSKRAAGSFYTASLFSERTRKIVRFLSRFG